MQLRIFYIAILFFANSTTYSQDVKFTASAPKYVKVGEQFQVQYSVNKSIDDFTPPSFTDFDFLGGPMQGSSTNISSINGKMTRVQTLSFTYFLRAKQPGKYTLQPAVVKYKKNQVNSNSLQIEVVGNSTPSNKSQGTSGTQASPSTSSTEGDEIFVRLVTDKKSAYVGEYITAWVKVYTKVNLADIDRRNFKGPQFSGFYQQSLEIPQLTNLDREKVGNEIYYSGVLQKVVLFPQKSGEIRIEPFDLTVYRKEQVKQSRGILDDFFGASYRSVPVQLKSKPVVINVKQLPGNQPKGFTGAVGTFKLRGSLSQSEVKTNDAVSFKVTLSGKGNIKLVETLDYDLPSTLQVYDPIVKNKIDKSGISGSKSFEITAIPRHSGSINVNPFKLVYFDPSTKTYKTVQTQPFEMKVEKGDSDSTSIVVSNLSKEDVELIGSDIRYIKPVDKLYGEDGYLLDNILYKLSYILLVLIFVAFIILKRKQIQRNANQAQMKHKKASKLAVKRFKKAKVLLGQSKMDLFYEEISKALWGYLSDKLNIPQSTLSTENAKQALVEHNIDEPLIEELFEMISNCEFARYAPGAVSKQPPDVYSDSMKLVMRIEQKF